MKQLIIIGAGGMGREVYSIAKGCIGYGTGFMIKGFLDYNEAILDGYEGYPPLLGNDESYEIQPEDVFISSIGTMATRQASIALLKRRGANFMTLVHKTAQILTNVKIGEGTLIQPFVHIGSDVQIGSHCMIQDNAVVGHDVSVGDFCRLDCFTMCVGGTIIENGVTIHTSAVINHNVVVGMGATVGACSFVIKKVKPHTTVFGVPASVK